MAFFFGVFRLGTRQFAMIAVITMAGYLVLIGALLRNRPGTVELDVELMRCAAISAVLFWFAAVGAYVSRLRKRLAVSKTRLEGAVRRIKEQADTDELTGVRNRRYLMDRLNREKSVAKRPARRSASASPTSIASSRLTTAWASVGDTVLRVVAQAGSRWVRVTDYFGRYAGDEFMFILTNSTLDGARQRAEQIPPPDRHARVHGPPGKPPRDTVSRCGQIPPGRGPRRYDSPRGRRPVPSQAGWPQSRDERRGIAPGPLRARPYGTVNVPDF